MKIILTCLLAIPFAFAGQGRLQFKKNLQTNVEKDMKSLKKLYQVKSKDKSDLVRLKKKTLHLKAKAVPLLVKVMQEKSYPIENRWVATYMLGRIMGTKSASFIAKFTEHKNWMLRLASLKVLLHLNQKKYKNIYAKLLKDKSLIVRHQALENIKLLKLKSLGSHVWRMLYNKDNYHGVQGKLKRSHIIREAVRIIGDLDYKKAKDPMIKMFKKNKFQDIYHDLDYSLSKLTGYKSPEGTISKKRKFWSMKL